VSIGFIDSRNRSGYSQGGVAPCTLVVISSPTLLRERTMAAIPSPADLIEDQTGNEWEVPTVTVVTLREAARESKPFARPVSPPVMPPPLMDKETAATDAGGKGGSAKPGGSQDMGGHDWT
jgi:hypothetical protein